MHLTEDEKKLTRRQKNLILEEIADFEFENIMSLSKVILSEGDFRLFKKEKEPSLMKSNKKLNLLRIKFKSISGPKATRNEIPPIYPCQRFRIPNNVIPALNISNKNVLYRKEL